MPVARCRHDDSRRKCTKKNPASQAPRPENTLPLPSEKEEPKPATVFCRNRRREAKPATGFIKKRRKLRIPWAESSKNGENCEFRGRNHQKTAKTANFVDRIVKKRQKLRIPWTESSKNGKNRLSPPWGKSKLPKNRVSPPWGKSKLPVFCVSPPWGKSKSPKNCVSQPWERQESKNRAHRLPHRII